MVSKAIIGHIRSQLNKGISLEEIKKNLVSQGLPLSEINQAFSNFKSGGSNAVPLTKQRIGYNVKIFLGVVFVIILILAFFFILSNVSKPAKSIFTIDEFNLLKGVYINLSETSEVNLILNDQGYIFIVDSVEENFICLSGDLNNTCFSIGEEKYFDLNNDYENDLFLKLIKIEDKLATLNLQKQKSTLCSENWDCSEWSICINGFEKRVCVDLNSCGTNINKPLVRDICLDNASQTYSAPPGSFLDCGISNESYVNECFLNAAETCTASAITGFAYIEEDPILATFGLNVSTNFSSYMEIKGPDENNTCVFYEKVLSYSQAYHPDYVQVLLNSGNYTFEEILQQEIELNSSAQEIIGIWNLCMYNQEGLVAMLNDYFENPSGNMNCSVEMGEEGPDYVFYSIECNYEEVVLIGVCASGQGDFPIL